MRYVSSFIYLYIYIFLSFHLPILPLLAPTPLSIPINPPPQNAPRPNGKSVGACQIMVHRLKGTLKTELAALRGVGEADVTGTPKKTPTPRKRKAKGDAEGEVAATPTKRGRKKKEVEEGVVEKLVDDDDDDDAEEEIVVKPEPKEEDVGYEE